MEKIQLHYTLYTRGKDKEDDFNHLSYQEIFDLYNKYKSELEEDLIKSGLNDKFEVVIKVDMYYHPLTKHLN